LVGYTKGGGQKPFSRPIGVSLQTLLGVGKAMEGELGGVGAREKGRLQWIGGGLRSWLAGMGWQAM